MPEPAALGPRRLWRAVIRPLVEEGSGDVVCDVSDGTIAEGLLVTTRATLHAVGPSEPLRQLSNVYGDRFVFHETAESAWTAADHCRLAVIDAGRAALDHVDALTALAAGDAPAPPVLLEGVSGTGGTNIATLEAFTARGWAVIELPGFEQIRLVLPGGQRVLDEPALNAILERLHAGVPAGIEQRAAGQAAEIKELGRRLEDAEQRAAVAEAGRELAERRRAATEDIVSALKLFNDQARGDLERARREVEDTRRLAEATRADAAAARARTARLMRLLANVRQDLVRLQKSHAWRLGHWLTRAARVLTFRKPGRTDAVSKAIGRVDAVTPSGDDDR